MNPEIEYTQKGGRNLPRICQQWVFLPCFRHRRLHFHARSKSLTINLKALSFRLFRCRFWGGSSPVGRPIFPAVSFVYILVCAATGRSYVGHTDHLIRR